MIAERRDAGSRRPGRDQEPAGRESLADKGVPTGLQHDAEQARTALRHLIELSGLTRKELKQRLRSAGSDTDLTRLLNGRIEIKLRHVLDLCRALGLHPLEFFRIAFKAPKQPSPFLLQLEEWTGTRRLPAPGAPVEPEDLADLRRSIAALARDIDALKAAYRRR